MREKIKEGVKRAIKRIDEFKPYRVEPPYEVIIEYKNKKSADWKAGLPGWERIGDMKCSYKTDDFLSIRW